MPTLRKETQQQPAKYFVPFLVVWIALTIGLAVSFWPQASEICDIPADINVSSIFYNASIWTGERKAYVGAMAVLENGRIGCTGALEEVSRYSQPATVYINLGGRFVTPGLIDAHTHILAGGLSLHVPDLSAVQSVAELKDIMQAACGRASAGSWVQGIGWDEVTWGGPEPHKSWLDDVCPQNPVVLHRMCSHKIAVNSVAEQIAGLDSTTNDPAGGRIYRDANGLTGVLAESAMDLVKSRIPQLSVLEKQELIKGASQYLLSQGVTMAFDMGVFPANEEEAFQNLEKVYAALAEAGDLPIRLFAFMPLTGWERLAKHVKAHGRSTADMQVFWGGLKEFADGSLGSKTALFNQPYVQGPGETPTSGVRTIEKDALLQLVRQADAEGLQVAIHAIGDLAVDDVIEIYSKVQVENAGKHADKGPEHRIEHVQHLSSPAAAAKLAEANVNAVMNPLHLLPDKRVLKSYLGEERAGAGHSYAFRTLLRAGAKLIFASDFPVVKSDPLLGIFAAHFRQAPSEHEGYVMEESVSLQAGLRATTINAARLAGLEDHIGTLRAGKLADFVVLSSDPLFMTLKFGPPRVLATYVGGKRVYSRGDEAGELQSSVV